MNKTYLCGKIGKSVKFNSNSWNGAGGDNEAPILFTKMAELNPDDNFIIIGRNDLETTKEKLNLPKNLYSVYEGATKEERKDQEYVYKRLKDIQVDGCFLISGPTGQTNLSNKVFKRKEIKEGKEVLAIALEMFHNYCGPIYHYLNETKLPWVMIVNDISYFKIGRDCLTPPSVILSQADGQCELRVLKSFEDQKELQSHKIDYSYAQMEKIGIIDKQIPKFEELNKEIKFAVVLNEYSNQGSKLRYDELKKYILNHIEDVSIYGKWNKKIVGDDTRFKGLLKINDLHELLPKVKYTFIVPFKPNWVTFKWVEMLSNGVLPFLHPDYDKQNHTKLPEFLRIKNPEDCHNKIEQLENDPELYKKLYNECIDLISEDDLNGKKLNKIIFNEINKYEYPKKKNKFKPLEVKEDNLINLIF